MATGCKKDHVTGFQFTATKELLIFSKEIDSDSAFFHEKCFQSIVDVPALEDMDVFLDPVPGIVLHVGQLLGEFPGGKEFDSVFLEFVTDDDGEDLAIREYLLYWWGIRSHVVGVSRISSKRY